MATRVVVCYTGGVGSQVIRLLTADPGYDVVGVLVHSAEKDGRDVGELVGLAPLGVTATRDLDALLDLRADCAMWHGAEWQPEIIARLLEAGTSVYSGIGGWFLPGTPDHDLIEAACRQGDAGFVAGGNIPGLISDTLPLFVSGYSGAVQRVEARQSNYVAHYPSALQLEHGLGIGADLDPDAPYPTPVDEMWMWGIRQSAALVAEGLGVELTDLRLTNKEFAPSPEDLELTPSGHKVRKGTPAGVRWTFTAFTGDIPFYQLVNEQTVRLGLAEGWRQSVDDPNWTVRVVGTPTVTATVALPHGEGEGDPVSALNAARAVNYIPRLLAAPAGWHTVLDLPAPRAATLALEGRP